MSHFKYDLSCASPEPVAVCDSDTLIVDGPIEGTVAAFEPDRVGLLRAHLHARADSLPDDKVGMAVQLLDNLETPTHMVRDTRGIVKG